MSDQLCPVGWIYLPDGTIVEGDAGRDEQGRPSAPFACTLPAGHDDVHLDATGATTTAEHEVPTPANPDPQPAPDPEPDPDPV